MSGEERQAQQLAEWLASPSSGPPSDLDSDVLEGLYALRPDLAPAPRLRADDILADLLEGPLALPAPDQLAAAAMADWLDAGGHAPDVLDEDVVEGITALRPDLAAPPSLTADDILASLPKVGAAPGPPPHPESKPANNHRWFLLSAAGGSGLLAVAAAALFTLTVSLQGASEGEVAMADQTVEEEAGEVEESPSTSAAREKTAAPSADAAPRTETLSAEASETKSKKEAAEPEPAWQDPTATGEEQDLSLGKAGLQDLKDDANARTGADEPLVVGNSTRGAGGGAGIGGLSGGRSDADSITATRSTEMSAPTRDSASPKTPAPKSSPRPSAVGQPAKREPLDERFAPPSASREAVVAKPSTPPMELEAEEIAVADLDEESEDIELDYTFSSDNLDQSPAGAAIQAESVERSFNNDSDTRARDRLTVRRSKSSSNAAVPVQDDRVMEESAVVEEPAADAPAPPPPPPPKSAADTVLRQRAVNGVGPVSRRAGTSSEITPPQAQGEPVAIHLAEAALARGDASGARNLIRSGLSLGGANTSEHAWLYVLDGDAAALQGDAVGAERSWREAIRLNNTRSPAPATESDQLMHTPD